MVEKAEDVEAKANLQSPFYVMEIDARCPKSHCPLAKKDKKNTYREYRNEASKDKGKAKSHNSTSVNQLQTQDPKKNKCGDRWGGHLATGVNTTKVAKKDKDKAKDLSHVQYYTCKQKGHYAIKYLEKSKN